jgi:hypothetical protein
MSAIADAIAAKKQPPEAVLSHLAADGDAIVGLGNGEPRTVAQLPLSPIAINSLGLLPSLASSRARSKVTNSAERLWATAA